MSKNKKTPKDLPVVFSQPIQVERHRHEPKHEREKAIWLWSGVTIVMATLIFFWVINLPERLRLTPGDSATAALFTDNKKELETVLDQQQINTEKLKTMISLYGQVVDALEKATSTATSTSQTKN
jgi:hypothetical protein